MPCKKLEIYGVDDNHFVSWLKAGYLEPVSKLTLSDTKITPSSLMLFTGLKNLTSLTVSEYYVSEKLDSPDFELYQANRERELQLALKQIESQTGIKTALMVPDVNKYHRS